MMLDTERLVIRSFRSDEVEKVYQLDSNYKVMKYITEGITLSKSESKKRLCSFIENYQQNDRLGVWLVELKDKKEFIGRASLLKNEDLNIIEIGYRLLPEFWGKGYASEVIESLSIYVKKKLKIDKLHAMTYPENIASKKLLEKMNFSFSREVSTFVPIPNKNILADLYFRDL